MQNTTMEDQATPLNAEGVVTGYVWERETDKLGLMGAIVLDFNGKRIELSGFTDTERILTQVSDFTDATVNEPFYRPGQDVSEHWTNPKFPIGSVVSFNFRELTRDGAGT